MREEESKNLAKHVTEIKLNALLEITKAINHNFSTEQLLEIFKDVLKTKLEIGKLVLYSNKDKGWECILKYGIEEGHDDIDIEADLLSMQEIGPIDFTESSLNKTFDIVVPVLHKSEPLAYVLIGDTEHNVELSPSYKHLDFVQTLTSIIVVAIENKKLAKENIRQAAMKKELELGSEMQTMLFPCPIMIE